MSSKQKQSMSKVSIMSITFFDGLEQCSRRALAAGPDNQPACPPSDPAVFSSFSVAGELVVASPWQSACSQCPQHLTANKNITVPEQHFCSLNLAQGGHQGDWCWINGHHYCWPSWWSCRETQKNLSLPRDGVLEGVAQKMCFIQEGIQDLQKRTTWNLNLELEINEIEITVLERARHASYMWWKAGHQ